MQNPIVSCGGMDCSVCSLLEVIQNIFVWLLGVTALIAVMALVVAGFIYISSTGSKELITKAKKFASYALVGFVATLASFISIGAIYSFIGASNRNNWFQIDCYGRSSHRLSQGSRTMNDMALDLRLNIKPANNVYDSVQDPEVATALDTSNLEAERLWQDVAGLKDGQRINFLVTEKTLDENEISLFSGEDKGFLQTGGGDRTTGTGIQKEVSIVKDSGNIIVSYEGDNPQIIGTIPEGEYSPDAQSTFEKVVALMKQEKSQNKNIYVYNDRNQDASSGFNEQACTESGGQVAVFANECKSRKYVCGEKNVQCSDQQNEMTGCHCPVGTCLKDQQCVKIEQDPTDYENDDQDNDGVVDSDDRCPNTPDGESINDDPNSTDYGCSCSQISLQTRTCPQSQCSGSNYLSYPPSGQDTCQDGKRIEYSCNPQTQFSPQCQQQVSQPFLPNYPQPVQNNNDQQQKALEDLLKQLAQRSGGGAGGGSNGNSGGSSGGSSGGGGGGSSGGGGSNTGSSPGAPSSGSSSDDSGQTASPGSTSQPQAQNWGDNQPLTQQEAFEGGNGTEGSPYQMSEKAMEKVFTYNEQTEKIDLDKNWESKLSVAGKDSYVKIPEKEKIVEAIDKKKKKDGKKELSDKEKEKLKDDKDAVKSSKGTNVVDKETNKEQTVDKDKKEDDPSKTKDDTLDPDKELLKARKAGDQDYEPQNAKEKWAADHGLVKSESGTFKNKNRGATDYFTPNVAEKLKRASDILRDEYGKDLNLTSGYRGGEGISESYSRHNAGRAADVNIGPDTSQNRQILESAMSKAGLKVLRWPSIYEWWHFSDDGH